MTISNDSISARKHTPRQIRNFYYPRERVAIAITGESYRMDDTAFAAIRLPKSVRAIDRL